MHVRIMINFQVYTLYVLSIYMRKEYVENEILSLVHIQYTVIYSLDQLITCGINGQILIQYITYYQIANIINMIHAFT